MPPEAQAADQAGAIAFIRHYVETMNYAYQTGDLAPTRALRKDECVACRSFEQNVEDGYTAGRHIEGGLFTVVDVAPAPMDPALGVDVVVVLRQAAGQVLDRHGVVVSEITASSDLPAGFVIRHEGTWSVVAWGAR